MEPDRFDDVELRVIEEPVQRGPRRSTRWALAVVAGVLSAATLAAGASALTSAGSQPASPAGEQLLQHVSSNASWSGAQPCVAHMPPASLPTAPLD
jgi:hypothetical protein